MRALIYYVAASLDGFIAHPDGRFDSFPMGDHVPAFLAELPGFGAVLMGRRTYAVGLEHGVTSPYPMIADQIVFSRSLGQSPDPAVRVLAEDAVGAVRRLKAVEGGPIWLCGGAELAGHLRRAGLIDELWVKLNPLLLGAGLPLFGGEGFDPRALDLSASRRFDSGVIELRYRLASPASAEPRRV